VGTTLYARDREKVVALDLGAKDGTPATTPAAPPARSSSTVRAGSAPVPSRPADFSGSWKLDTSASTVTTGAGLSGLHPNGAPAWVFVTQPANGTILMESATNASQSRFYRPGKPATTATAGGTITMTAAWQGKTLVAEGQLTASSGAVTVVTETISRSDDALVIEIAAGDKTSRLRYVRLTDTGACESWPNPCKKAGGL